MLKKIGTVTGVDVFLKIFSFFLIPLYLVWMPKEEFGEFGFLYAIIGILPSILTLGLYVPQIKELSASLDLNEKKYIFSTTFNSVLIALLAASILIHIGSINIEIINKIFGVEKSIELKWKYFLINVIFGSLNLILYSLILSLKNAKIIIIHNILKFALGNLFALLFIHYRCMESDTSLDRLAGVAIGEILLMIILFLWIAKKYYILHINLIYLKKAFQIALPIIPGSIALFISSFSDRYFINVNFDSSHVAEYNLAMQFITPIQMIIVGAQTIWAPHIYSIKNNFDANKEAINFTKKLLVVLLLTIPVVTLMVEIASALGYIPSNYEDTIYLVPALAVPAIITALLQIPFNLMIRNEKTHYIAYLLIISTILTVLGGAIFIPLYGYFSIAIFGAIVQITILGMAFLIVVKINTINIK